MNFPRRIVVLDWAGGRLVHAVAGNRARYQDLATRFPALAGRSPHELLRVARREFGIDQVYVAELDRLQPTTGAEAEAEIVTAKRLTPGNADLPGANRFSPRSEPTPRATADSGLDDSIAEWLNDGWTVWSDRGRDVLGTGTEQVIAALGAHPRWRPIWGTESFGSPNELFAALRAGGEPSRWTVSLDLFGTQSLVWFGHGAEVAPTGAAHRLTAPVNADETPSAWERVSLPSVVSELRSCGVRRVLILNLADVGTASNTTGPLLLELRSSFPDLELLSGGGVRDWATVKHLGACGADHVLVGTWLWGQMAASGPLPR